MVKKIVLGVSLLATALQPAFAAEQCMSMSEKIAFDVRVLQTQLMIAATACGQSDAYNVFVNRHQPDLMNAYDKITTHFGRVYGSGGQVQRDIYITELANVQSEEGNHDPDFCRHMQPFVIRALTLQTRFEMSQFVNFMSISNPYSLEICQDRFAGMDDQAPGETKLPGTNLMDRLKAASVEADMGEAPTASDAPPQVLPPTDRQKPQQSKVAARIPWSTQR